jgi:hypothetical protein
VIPRIDRRTGFLKRDWRAEHERIGAHVHTYSRHECPAMFSILRASAFGFLPFRHVPWMRDDARAQVIAARELRDRMKAESIPFLPEQMK